MGIARKFNPGPGVADFWHEFRRPNPYRWPILGVSILLTGGLLYSITQERVVGPPPRPEVTYITTFAPDRTDAEIAATNLANQRVKDEREAERARIEEEKRELYRALGRASGMDVDRMEREAAEERAREEAATAARIEARRAAAAQAAQQADSPDS